MFWPDNYLVQVARQIRATRARDPLVSELRDHMLCQKAKYMESGLSEDEAERRTTEDMGDALLVGGELDAAHRPTPQWMGLLAAVLLLALGLVLQLANGALAGASPMDTLGGSRAVFTLFALVVLCLFAFSDYTFWIRWSLPVFFAWLLMVFYRLWLWVALNPEIPLYQGLGFILASPVLAAFVPQELAAATPLMAALLVCRLRGRGWGALALSLTPVLSLMLLCWVYRYTGYDIAPCMLMAALGLGVLALAILQGFFRVRRVPALILPGVLFALALIFAASRFSLQSPDSDMRRLIATLLSGARPIGPGEAMAEAGEAWRRFIDMGYGIADYMLPALVAQWGWLPCAALLTGPAALLGLGVKRLARLENRMGALLGMAAAGTLALQAALYIPASFGLTAEHLCLPLMSYGHAMLMTDAALVGLMLGILRGARLPEQPIPLRRTSRAALND